MRWQTAPTKQAWYVVIDTTGLKVFGAVAPSQTADRRWERDDADIRHGDTRARYSSPRLSLCGWRGNRTKTNGDGAGNADPIRLLKRPTDSLYLPVYIRLVLSAI